MKEEQETLLRMISSYCWWNVFDLVDCYALPSEESDRIQKEIEDLFRSLTNGKELVQ